MERKVDKKLYERLSGKKLTDQEAFEAKSNFVGLFYLLHKLDIRNKERAEFQKSEKKSVRKFKSVYD